MDTTGSADNLASDIAASGQMTIQDDISNAKGPEGAFTGSSEARTEGDAKPPDRLDRGGATVDVIVPIYNALDDVQRCLAALSSNDDEPRLRVIAVNDGSAELTTQWLREVSRRDPRLLLVEHEQNRGYTSAVNSGLLRSSAPYVLLLNSDAIVTRGAIARILRCAESSAQIGIVGPLSNAASWQNVPRLRDTRGKFAVNSLPEGLSAEDVAQVVATASRQLYPRMPFVNGFCFLIKREVLDRVGVFDEQTFPQGYGEENDFCIRAAEAGFELAVADDAYVYHVKSRSFGHGRRRQLVSAGDVALRAKHGDDKVDALVAQIRELDALKRVRLEVSAALEKRCPPAPPVDPLTMRVLFLLPVKGGAGGSHSVIQEATAMRRLGVHVRVAVRAKHYERACEIYGDVPNIKELLVPFTPENLVDVGYGYDVAVATIYTSVDLVSELIAAYPEILPAYYVQDYEPWFFERGSAEYEAARASYEKISGMVLFAKTRWIAERLMTEHAVPVHKVSASIDHSVYFPATPARRDRPVVTAMIRPKTPRRGAARTMRVLRELAYRFGSAVEVHTFGCETSDPAFLELERAFEFVHHGVLTRPQVAELLRRSDVFIDLSDYQAFGRTGLEAMASGCVAVVPAEGGTDDYARDGENAIVVDTSDERLCVERVAALLADPDTRLSLKRQGLLTAARYSPHRAALSELEVVAKALARHRSGQPAVARRHVVLSPPRAARDQVSQVGYVRLLRPWRNPTLHRHWWAEVSSGNALPEPGSADVFILHSDSPAANPLHLCDWLMKWRNAGGKLVLDVSGPVFEPLNPNGSLPQDSRSSNRRLEWLATVADAVVVSTPALAARLQRLNPSVHLIPTAIDARLWRLHETPGEPNLQSDVSIIGYLGPPGQHLDVVAAAASKFGDDLGIRLRVEVVGAFERGPVRFGERVGLPRRRSYPDYVDWLHQRVRWDLALLPVSGKISEDDARLRFLEYAALGVPVVCSDVPSLRDIVEHGRTGWFVANDPGAWRVAVKRLLEEPALRHELAGAARRYVSERFTLEAHEQQFLEILRRVMEQPARPEADVALNRIARSFGARMQSVISRARPSLDVLPSPGPLRKAMQRARLGRKLAKLRRDPGRFFADSRSGAVRAVGLLVARVRTDHG